MSDDAGVAIEALRSVLLVERDAIRRLDGAGVARAAEAKQASATRLAALEPADLASYRGSLIALRAELRHNGVLLAHARACLREAVQLVNGTHLAATV